MTTLPSGLRVATEAHPGAATASVAVLFDAGSRFEGATTVGTGEWVGVCGSNRRFPRRLCWWQRRWASSVSASDSHSPTAHFLEHLALKGTKRRSMATIEQEIEGGLVARRLSGSTVGWLAGCLLCLYA